MLIQASIFLSDLNLIDVWQKKVLALFWAPGVFWNLLTQGLFLEVNFCIGVHSRAVGLETDSKATHCPQQY